MIDVMKKTGINMDKHEITYFNTDKNEIITESVFGVDPYLCDNCKEWVAPKRPADNKCPFCKEVKLKYFDLWL